MKKLETRADGSGKLGRWRTKLSRTLASLQLSRTQRLLALAACTGLAITQPILGLFGGNPEIFIFNGLDGITLVWIALVVAVIPTVVLWTIGALIGRIRPRAGMATHLAFLWILLLLAAIQLVKFQLGVTEPLAVSLIAFVGATAVILAYVSVDGVGQLIRAMGVLPIVSVLLFLFASPAADLLTDAESVATAGAAGVSDTNVIVLLLDELPTSSILDDTNNIDRDRFPNLAALADGASWYRQFTANATLTERAVPTLLAGRDGVEDTALWTNYPDSLFSVVAPTHDLVVSESFTRLCGYESCSISSDGDDDAGRGGPGSTPDLGRFFDQATELYRGRVALRTPRIALDVFEEESPAAPAVEPLDDSDTVFPAMEGREGSLLFPKSLENTVGLPGRFTDFVAAVKPGARPGLFFLHLVLPHQPWRYFDDGQIYNTDELSPDFPSILRENDGDAWVAALTEQRLLLQASYTDRLVGGLIEHLENVGLYDDSLIIVAADHGISFELDTHIREVDRESLDSLAYAPLVIKYPGQTDGVVDDSNAMAVDLLPTITDVLGLETPETVTGVAIGSPAQAERGAEKYILDVADDGSRRILGRVEFGSEAFPDPFDRWIHPGSETIGLSAIAGVEDLIGESLDSLAPEPGGGVMIDSLDGHESPGDVPEAIVVGRTDVATSGTIVVAVDGTIVAGSPLYEFDDTPGSFAALLPSSVVPKTKTLRVALLQDGRAVELEIARVG